MQTLRSFWNNTATVTANPVTRCHSWCVLPKFILIAMSKTWLGPPLFTDKGTEAREGSVTFGVSTLVSIKKEDVLINCDPRNHSFGSPIFLLQASGKPASGYLSVRTGACAHPNVSQFPYCAYNNENGAGGSPVAEYRAGAGLDHLN